MARATRARAKDSESQRKEKKIVICTFVYTISSHARARFGYFGAVNIAAATVVAATAAVVADRVEHA